MTTTTKPGFGRPSRPAPYSSGSLPLLKPLAAAGAARILLLRPHRYYCHRLARVRSRPLLLRRLRLRCQMPRTAATGSILPATTAGAGCCWCRCLPV